MYNKYFQNIVTLDELQKSGISRHQVARLVRARELIRCARGVYTYREFSQSVPDYEKPLARIVVTLKCTKDPVLSHQSAALWFGVPLIRQPDSVHLISRYDRSRRTPGVKVHRNRAEAVDGAVLFHGAKVTTAEQTLSDCIDTLPLVEVLNIANYFLKNNLLTFAGLHRVLNQPRRRNKRYPDLLEERISLECESPLETVVWNVLYEGNFPSPRQQFRIDCDFGKHYRADFAWPELMLIVEADGQHKYSGQFGKPENVIREEHARQRELERKGWRIVRVTWQEILSQPEAFKQRLYENGLREVS